jgi:peptidoglycan/LPS O-acetylase OafA/YrhL
MVDRPPARVEALSGLRFAAAGGILLFHVGAALFAGAPAWAERIRAGGYVWVGMFYLLSGFVLAHAHPAPLDAAARRAFLAARLARLYPAYLLGFVLFAPFALERWWGGGPLSTAKAGVVALACLLLAQAWVTPLARIWNPPGWSTSVVASFYLAFPRILRWLAPRSRAGLWGAAAGAWLAGLALPLAYLALAPDGPGAVQLAHEPPWLAALKFHPLARGGEFVIGVALGLLVRTRGLALRRAGGAAAAVALATVAAVLAWGRVPYVLLHNGILLPVFAVMVVGLASGGAGWAARILGSRPGRLLGDASFALYALQDPLWRWARALHGEAGLPSAAFAAAFCIIAVIAAVAVSRGLERPARRWLRRALALPPPQDPGAGRAGRAAPTGQAEPSRA